MSHEFVHPNLHVVLIHFPIALLIVGTLIELFAFLWRKSSFRVAGKWMILIGALALVPTSTSGLYAMWDVNRTAETEFATWAEVRAGSPVQGASWELMTEHAWFSAGGSVVILLVVVLWLGCCDKWRSRLHFLFLLLLIGGLAVIVNGAWHAGEMIYRHGVAVDVAPAGSAVSGEAGEHGPRPEARNLKECAAFYAPPLQVHVILAGSVISLALAAIGLSMRAGALAKASREPMPQATDISIALNPNTRAAVLARAEGMPDDPHRTSQAIPRPPAGRFWLLAVLVAILTALSGWWTLAHGSDVWTVKGLWEIVTDRALNNWTINRHLAHIIMTGTIIILLLILALASRFATGRRFVLGFFTLLLLIAVSAQVWFGSLLLFDTPSGPLGQFNAASDAAAEMKIEKPAPTTLPTSAAVKPPSSIPASAPTTVPAP